MVTTQTTELQRAKLDENGRNAGRVNEPRKSTIVFLGLGHTSALVLRRWRDERPRNDVRLVCVSNSPVATYSGMLPGVLAGQYRPSDMTIDLQRLCGDAGAELIVGETIVVDRAARRLQIAPSIATDSASRDGGASGHLSIDYDYLVVGVGSRPRLPPLVARGGGPPRSLVPIKPMQTFVERLRARVREVVGRLSHQQPLRLLVVGGGAGGVEIATCISQFVRREAPGRPFVVTLVAAGAQLVGDARPRTGRRLQFELERQGVRVLLGRRVVELAELVDTDETSDSARGASRGIARLDDGAQLECDIVLWATDAVGPAVLERFDLPRDDRGFLLIRSTLQTIADERVFVVGDAGTLNTGRTTKAGVFAVRQAPVLWENLHAILDGRPLRDFRPQQDFLRLLNLGDGRALGQYRALTFTGRWVWRWKDRIDRRFLAQFPQVDYNPRHVAET